MLLVLQALNLTAYHQADTVRYSPDGRSDVIHKRIVMVDPDLGRKSSLQLLEQKSGSLRTEPEFYLSFFGKNAEEI